MVLNVAPKPNFESTQRSSIRIVSEARVDAFDARRGAREGLDHHGCSREGAEVHGRRLLLNHQPLPGLELLLPK